MSLNRRRLTLIVFVAMVCACLEPADRLIPVVQPVARDAGPNLPIMVLIGCRTRARDRMVLLLTRQPQCMQLLFEADAGQRLPFPVVGPENFQLVDARAGRCDDLKDQNDGGLDRSAPRPEHVQGSFGFDAGYRDDPFLSIDEGSAQIGDAGYYLELGWIIGGACDWEP